MRDNEYIDRALSIVEEARYKTGIMEFVSHFFDYWAFKQTNLYQPSEDPEHKIEELFIRLSDCLAEGARFNPESDIFGRFLSQCQFKNRGTEFYPTPESVANLMSQIILNNSEECSNQSDKTYYEPCVGTGVNVIAWLSTMQGKGYKVSELTLYLEEIDRVVIKACFMQLMFYFEAINEWPRFISLNCIDSITRRSNGIAYVGSGITQSE